MHWRRRLALNGLYRTPGFSMRLEVIEKMERETGLEPATSSLGSWHSTTELLPLSTLYKHHWLQWLH